MLKEIATQGIIVEIIPINPVDDTTGIIVLIGTPQDKEKAEGNGIYIEGLQVSISSISVPAVGASIPDVGLYTEEFVATAKKVKVEGSVVLRVDDETAIITAYPEIPATPDAIPYPTSFTIRITDANQTKVKAL